MKNNFFYVILFMLSLSLLTNSCKKKEKEAEENNSSLLVFDNTKPELLSFINENEGWIYTYDYNTNKNNLLHSTDGFSHHTVINADMPDLIKITFINANVGFGDTYYDNNYFTLDGGVTWTAFQNPPLENYGWMTYNTNYFMTPLFDYNASLGHQYVGVCFYNRNDGSYSHTITYTAVAVSTYHGSAGGNIHQSSVHVTDNGSVAFAGIDYDDANFNNHFYTGFSTNTTDLSITEILGAHSPERLVFPSDNTGFYTQKDDEKLYKTTNGGQAWTSAYTFNSTAYKELSFASNTHGAVLVDDKVYFTDDSGQHFSKYQLDTQNALVSGIVAVAYPTQSTAYAIATYIDNSSIQTFKLIKITP